MSYQNLTLLTDLYELTMMQGYYKNKSRNDTVIFDMFYRTNPLDNGYAIAAGLEQIQMARDDARGAGFRLYAAQYPLVKDMTALRKTPFTEYIPVDLEKVKSEAHRLLG